MHARTFIGSEGISSFVSLVVLLGAACGADFHVADDAAPGGDGSKGKPWSLAAALAHPATLKAGDTIWLRDGTYRGGFRSTLKGTKEAPITLRGAGERAVVDCKPRDAEDSGTFTVEGEWTAFRDLEFTCSDPKRVTQQKGSWPVEMRRGGVDSRGSHISFINLVVHDTMGGFGFWGNEKGGEGGEIYGCVISHCGWRGPDRGHGHGIYAQNARGTKRIVDNVIFNHFGYGLHAYGSDTAFLRGFHIEGNVAFNNGCLTAPKERTTDLFIGGGSAIEGLTLLDNYTYGGGGLRLGYAGDVQNRGIVARGNYIGGESRFLALAQMNFSGNTLISRGTLVSLHKAAPSTAGEITWDGNNYLRPKTDWKPFSLSENGKSEGLTFADWQKRAGFDATSSYEEAAARGTKVIVRPNRFEKGRAHIVVYNWERQPSVDVKLDGVLAPGQRYRIVSAQSMAGDTIVAGTWNGAPIKLPMNPTKPAQPIGMPDYELPITEPEFGVFVVLPVRKK